MDRTGIDPETAEGIFIHKIYPGDQLSTILLSAYKLKEKMKKMS